MLKLYCVQWRFYVEGRAHRSRMGTHIESGYRVARHRFFSNEKDARVLFEEIKEDPPCHDTINLRMCRVVVPEHKNELLEFLNEIVDRYPDENEATYRGLKFRDENHEELDEHLGFQFNQNLSW